jgi:hypothetical protein
MLFLLLEFLVLLGISLIFVGFHLFLIDLLSVQANIFFTSIGLFIAKKVIL